MATKGFAKVGDLVDKYKLDNTDKYISREFQKYGYDLALELGDPDNVSLYIKLAKTYPRVLLEQAKSFVSDAYNVKSKPKLYMWKLHQLKSQISNLKSKSDSSKP